MSSFTHTPSRPIDIASRSRTASAVQPEDEVAQSCPTSSQGKPFSASEMLKDPSLAAAALKELGGSGRESTSSAGALRWFSGAGRASWDGAARGGSGLNGKLADGEGASADLPFWGSDHLGEVERQRSALETLDADVQEESKVNKEISDLVVERLEGGKSMLEGLSKQLCAMAAAEAAYAQAMGKISPTPALKRANTDGGMPTLTHMLQLPSTISQAHKGLHASLHSICQEIAQLLARFREMCKEVHQESVLLQNSLASARKALADSFAAHAAACEAADVVCQERQRGRVCRGPDADPWATESDLVRAHKSLGKLLDKERAFLRTAFSHAKELEAARLEVTWQVMGGACDAYRNAAVPPHMELANMAAAAEAPPPDVSFGNDHPRLLELKKAGQTAADAAAALAARQASDIQCCVSELYSSPEIVKQGEMMYWDARASVWQQGHAVLTRAGFLHWVHSEGNDPAKEKRDMFCLSRSNFATSQPPVIAVEEAGWIGARLGSLSNALTSFVPYGQNRKAMLQAQSVEECCEWAIAIREAIAVASGRQLQ